MGELKNITFNPATGLFEDCTNPTAHLTQGEIRRLRRQRQQDPMALYMKPVIRSLFLSNGEHPAVGSTMEMSWYVDKAQRVAITFPSGNTVEFPPASSCKFVVPKHKFHIRLTAYNGKYHTQRTITIEPLMSLLQRLFSSFFTKK